MPTKTKLLDYLKQNKGIWVSGQDISGKLSVSRAAVNKHISGLRSKGYEIQSSTKKGYLFSGQRDIFIAAEIAEGLETKVIGKQGIVCLESAGSTNSHAKKLAESGAPEGSLVIAEAQTSGRGRKGRTWFSCPGLGIYASLILRPALSPEEAPAITLMTAVAAVRAVIAITGLVPEIKWPNDLMVKGKKLAGILTEISTEMDSIDYIIVGMGLNVNISKKDIPLELKDIATSIFMETGKRFERTKILQSYLENYENLYEKFKKSGFTSIKEHWLALSHIKGREVVVKNFGKEVSGKVAGIDDNGVLMVEDINKEIHRIFSGDLFFPAKD